VALRIYLTGRIALEYDGALFDQDAFAGRQGALVFARLSMPRGSAVSRDELAALLWDDKLPKAWDVALNAVVSKLRVLLARTGLDKAQVLPSALGCYQLNLPADAWLDVDAAFDSLHAAEGMLRHDRHRDAWAAAQVAFHILKRPFMPAETGDWVVKKREQLATLHVRACECLAESYIRNEEPLIAVDVARQALAAQPLRETAYQILMRAHAAAGNRAQALHTYEACRRLISDELGVAPSAETESVYLGILRSR
jgi:SARP family transcriptional regulator, regulator of embCAB operon